MLAAADARAHERHPHAVHDRLHVGEVEVDLARHGDEIGDALHGLAEDVVGDLEGLAEGRGALDEVQEALVRDRDQRVDGLAQRADAVLRLHAPPLPFEGERLRDDGDRERAELRGQRGDDRRGAGAGAAAHAGGDEDHVGAAEGLEDAIGVFQRRLLADFGIGAGAQALGQLGPDLNLGRGQRGAHGLDVRVGDEELDALDPRLNHPVDGVPTTPAHPDDLDLRRELLFVELHAERSLPWLFVKCDHLPSPKY